MATFPTIQPSGLINQPGPAPAVGRGVDLAQAAGVVLSTIAGADARETAQRERAEKEFAARQYQDEAHLAITNSVGAEHMQSLTDAQDAASTGQMTGFVDRWGKGFDQRVKDGEQSIPDIGKAAYREQMASLKNQLQPRFAQQEIGARNAGLVQSAGDASDTSANIVYADRSQGMDQLARTRASIAGLLLPDEEKARLNERATQSIGYAYGANFAGGDPRGFLARYTGAAGAKNIAGDPMLATLKPENMERLTQHAMTLVAQQDAAGARGADESEKIASDETTKLRKFVDQGQPPDLNYVARIKAATTGTSYAATADALLDQAQKNAGYGAHTLPQQRQILDGMQAQAGNGTNPEDAAVLESRREITSQQDAAFKSDPIDAYSRFAKGAVSPPQTINSVDDAISVVQQRAPSLPGIETYGGVPGVSPLRPQEAQELAESLSHLPVPQQARALDQLGASLGNPDRIAALAKQIGDADGTLGLAMAYSGTTNAAQRRVGELILRGAQAMKDRTSSEDTAKQTGWRSTIAASLRGVYADKRVEDRAIDAALKVTAGLEQIGQGADPADGVTLATGGVIEHGAADGKIPLPYGIPTKDGFEAKLGQITPQTLAAQAPDGQVYAGGRALDGGLARFVSGLPDATLAHAGQGLYNVKAGSYYVTNARGQRITLTVRP